MSRSFNHPHYGFVCGRHDAAWQPRARNPQDWDLGWLEAIGWTQESLAFLTQQFNCSTCAARCARALSCWNTKSLPDSLRITGSNMTSLWRRGQRRTQGGCLGCQNTPLSWGLGYFCHCTLQVKSLTSWPKNQGVCHSGLHKWLEPL